MRYVYLVLFVAIGLMFISSNAFAQLDNFISPLKQVQSGVLPQNVKCNQDLVLIIAENGTPACVRPATEQKLLDRGWITPEKFESAQPIIQSNVTSVISPNVLANNTTAVNQTLAPTNGTSISNSTNNILNNSINTQTINLITQNQTIPINVTITSNKPNSVKIISIGLSPYPLKVGEIATFSITYQNILGEPLYAYEGCQAHPIGVIIYPFDVVSASFPRERLPECADGPRIIEPNDTHTSYGSPDPAGPQNLNNFDYAGFGYGFYTITKPSSLHITMELFLRINHPTDKYDILETVQFETNAT